MKKILAALTAVVIGATGLTACSSGGSSSGYYDTLCVNPLTQIREPDYYCLVGNPYYNPLWIYYVPYGYLAPAYGVHLTHYSSSNYRKPTSGTIHTGGVPSTGGKAPKSSTGNTVVKSTTKPTTKSTSKPKSGSSKVNLNKSKPKAPTKQYKAPKAPSFKKH